MIRATVKTIPHPNSQKLTDLWVQMVLDELLRREKEQSVVTA